MGDQSRYHAPAPPIWTRRLDAIFLHPALGPLVFALVVYGVFWTIFFSADPMMNAVDSLREISGKWIGSLDPCGVDPFVAGGRHFGRRGRGGQVPAANSAAVSVHWRSRRLGITWRAPRRSRIRTMARFLCQGKSFIPLLSAYACAVPAIMATRTIENKRDRIATILIAPFMTCSARLPIYILVIETFIPKRRVWYFLDSQVAAFIGLYILGFAMAVLTARVLKSTVLKSGRSSFILEMPAYRWPTLRSLGLRLLDRSKVFMRRAGTVILRESPIVDVGSELSAALRAGSLRPSRKASRARSDTWWNP